MKVELVRFYPFETSLKKPKLLGYADVQIDGALVIKGIKLFESKYGGYFIQFPTLEKEGKSYSILDVKSKELTEKIRRVIVDYYKENAL